MKYFFWGTEEVICILDNQVKNEKLKNIQGCGVETPC